MKVKLFSIFLLILCLFTACASSAEPEETDELDEALEQIEQALPEGYEKTSQTEVYDFVFSDENDNQMIYYLCVTTYYTDDAETVTGLDLNALSAVFDIRNTPVQLEFEVSGHSAAIYQGKTCNYLCWTTSPEASAVLEYDPAVISEEDAIRIARSVYEVPET